MHIPELHILNCSLLYIIFVRFMLPHLAMEVAHMLLSAELSPFLLREEEMNVRIYLLFYVDLDIDAFSEICILLHCHLGAWYGVTTFRRRFCGTPRPFVDDFSGHPVSPTHVPDRTVNVTVGSYTHVHTLPHPKWHETKYTNFMAVNKSREMRFINYY
jgi:hypothetical protein